MKKNVFILSIDGGGIRGVIPAFVLDNLYHRLNKINRGKYLYQHFDLIAGTSTGGLLALAMASPLLQKGKTATPKYGTEALIKLYTEIGINIFSRAGRPWLRKLSVLFHHKYTNQYLKSLMEELYGNATMSQALRPLVITAFDAKRMSPFVFSSHTRSPYGDFFIKDAARATSAAPVYFPPARVKSIGGHEKAFHLIDGGVVANNPSLLALKEAKKLYPNAKNYIILSIGTGYSISGYTVDEMNKWGVAQWMSPSRHVPLLNIMMTGQAENINYTLSSFPEVKYIRWNIEIDPAEGSLDNIKEQNLQYLQTKARQLIDMNSGTMDLIVELLSKNVAAV
ncbi:MAG: hypothetical protein HKN68_06435 [Saprospiraceae bacterium]|nr:hypothetical protein [Saprospiraceae bacterium]